MIHAMHVMHMMEHGVLHEDDMMMQFHDMCMQGEWHIRNTNNNQPLSSGTVRVRAKGILGSGQKGRSPP